MNKLKRFFVLEGVDYAGKGTITSFLQKDFPNAVFTREPGGTVEAEKIRALLLSEEGSRLSDQERLDLFFKSREIHIKEKIIPALEENKLIISDRFDGSSFAYQVKSPELEERFWSLRREIVEGKVSPIYIFLNISVEESLRRRALAKGRDLNHFDQATMKEVQGRYDRYSNFLRKVSSPVYIIDGSVEREDVYRQVKQVLLKELN